MNSEVNRKANSGRELLKGNTDSLLLCLINHQPMYGYQIIKELRKKSSGYFQFREGTLYPALHRLEKAGFIRSHWQRTSGGKERRYYFITDKGQETLSEKLAAWRGFSAAVNSIMQPSSA